MKTYTVNLDFETFTTQVEAKDEAEAIEIAREQIVKTQWVPEETEADAYVFEEI